MNHFSNLTRLKGSRDQVRLETGPKPKLKLKFLLPILNEGKFRSFVGSSSFCVVVRCAAVLARGDLARDAAHSSPQSNKVLRPIPGNRAPDVFSACLSVAVL